MEFNEQDQKRRAGQIPIVLPSDAGVSDKTVPEVQVKFTGTPPCQLPEFPLTY
jgi:hypothetical protein